MHTALHFRVPPNECLEDTYWISHNPEKLSWDSDDREKVMLSYHDLNVIVGTIMTMLSESLTRISTLRKNEQSVVAISIPEGPWLQFAVLAVHFLNVTTSCPDDAPILLPLDPEEGLDRLAHMLIDAHPKVILYLREEDREKLLKATISVQKQNAQLSSDIFTFINVRDLVKGNNHQNEHIQFQLELASTDAISNRISHICYTSGTSGTPKGCVSSIHSLLFYIKEKNKSHRVSADSRVFLASALPFDPCLSDIIATYYAGATLCVAPRAVIKYDLSSTITDLQVTHILCTPSLWNGVESESRNCLGCLKVVALGGEPMSGRIRGWWGRTRDKFNHVQGDLRLLSTYGVTEACVYQTVGEVFADDELSKEGGQDVGLPLEGLQTRICSDEKLTAVPAGEKGEIILSGNQLDSFSCYLNLPDMTTSKFVRHANSVSYRTGDLGFIDLKTGHLFICGRIHGEEGMVKFNGVRIELGEVEHAILDSASISQQSGYIPLVTGCMVDVRAINKDGDKRMIAYCVLSDMCLKEIGISFCTDIEGVICAASSPLHTLFLTRCKERVRKGCTPSIFVLIKKIPLTRTGKCDRKALPSLESCVQEESLRGDGEKTISLRSCGVSGLSLHNELVSSLNIHSSQYHMITSSISFPMLGGDSLTATRVVRSLYATHKGVNNSRTLGGEYGTLPYPFDASTLISSKTLGAYVDLLDSLPFGCDENVTDSDDCSYNRDNNSDVYRLYEVLLEAVQSGQTSIAIALLQEGVNPNEFVSHKRLGKVQGRMDMKESFRSSPMHLACMRGDIVLVRNLFLFGCSCKTPDASGSYPIHLACSGWGQGLSSNNAHQSLLGFEQEDLGRLQCVRFLLDEASMPLTMKNRNNQTVIHCAARSGFTRLLQFLIERWISDPNIRPVLLWGESKLDWQDRWFRTPLHWSVLHSHYEAVRLLIIYGASTSPKQPKLKFKVGKRTSGTLESPLEICVRLYGNEPQDEVGKKILNALISPELLVQSR